MTPTEFGSLLLVGSGSLLVVASGFGLHAPASSVERSLLLGFISLGIAAIFSGFVLAMGGAA